ncbi:NrpR regulatory domain-containing protein [Natrinema ejinorense]|uniref:Ribonuclease R n=1 Tax=Natrinema ejinorense TaxID=373386 RepID=A0A2A5QSZ8_9EURY|nr:NrpR regulatory domain-containing protein [Natrinema ejinorense]PCR89961.1 ribonuclease R [Natrinema ejinorense]
MVPNDDRRTYDLLRLIGENEPIGSIRLVEQMQRRGYSIKGRTIRLMLSDLDEAGLTEKVAGKGRRLTDRGRDELERGDVSGRLESIRERIATLTSRVTYDPTDDVGELVVGTVRLSPAAIEPAFDHLERLHESTLGPILVAATDDDTREGIELAFPSSISLDGVLLSRGIDSRLITAGLVEYDDEVRRYIDAISGENATMDVITLLVEAGRTDIDRYLEGETGVFIVDNREFPLTRFEEGQDLATATRDAIGGAVDLRRPRESGPFPAGNPSWDFASLTYLGTSETAISLLYEQGLATEWESLTDIRPRSAFEPAPTARRRF